MKTKGKADEFDVYVGKRIWLARRFSKMSQKELGDILGVKFQQVQKYEKGTNRTAVSLLYKISGIFNYDINWFLPPRDEPQDTGGRE